MKLVCILLCLCMACLPPVCGAEPIGMDEPVTLSQLQDALDQLQKGYEVLNGCALPGGFAALCQHPRQSGRTLMLCTPGGAGEKQLTQVKGLPADTDFASFQPLALRLPGCDQEASYLLGQEADGTWGLCGMALRDGFLSLHAQYAMLGNEQLIWCSHPWQDALSISWGTLPGTLVEAALQLDMTGWGVVANPVPHDRLHLRQRPDAASKSLGSYETGAPVQILGSTKGWLHVLAGGREGWMKQEYIAYGDAQLSVASACPQAEVQYEDTACYAPGNTASPLRMLLPGEKLLVLGVIGEKWYHALLTGSGEFVLVSMMDLSL